MTIEEFSNLEISEKKEIIKEVNESNIYTKPFWFERLYTALKKNAPQCISIYPQLKSSYLELS